MATNLPFQNIFQGKLWGKAAPEELKKPSGQLAFVYDELTDADKIVQDFGGGITGLEYTFNQVPADEVELISRYRALSRDADIDEAIGEIKNEVFIFNDGQRPFDVDFVDGSKVSEKVKGLIQEEFEVVYQLLDFNKQGIRWFENWFVDSKIVFHKVVDDTKIKEGVQRIIPIDPLTIRKIKKLPKPDSKGYYDPSKIEEFYSYVPGTRRNSKSPDQTTIGWNTTLHGLQLSPESITFVDSGLYDRNTGKTIGYLHKSIAPFNQLRGMEDAMMIYRLARAPSRRAFYVDVGGLSKAQGESYIQSLMRRYSTKLVYDPQTGSVVNKKNVLSITEDYWLPRREGKNTEISTIDGQDTTNILEEVKYYRDRLYSALGVPRNRFGQEQSAFNFGKGTEIDRDEYRFMKFIDRLRAQFMNVFLDILKTNLILKNVITVEDWEEIVSDLVWRFAEDNSFVEWKEAEVLASRLATMRDASDLIGKYVSSEWAAKNILKMTDAEIRDEKKKIKKEREENESQEGGEFGGPVEIDPDVAPEGDSQQVFRPAVPPEIPNVDSQV